MTPARLIYVTDTYCIWCWAFGEALREFVARNAGRLTLEVLPAGMLVGERVVPVGQKPRVLETARRVTELTGARFGDGFRASVERGKTVLDSGVSAAAFWALHAQAPQRGLDIAHALQHAWYVDGRDLHDEAVVADVARALNLDPARATSDVRRPETLAQSQAGFARRQTLPVEGYPTLLMQTPEGYRRLGGATTSAEKLQQEFEAILHGEPEAQQATA
ncbi:putative protein-disulfide isomerase [Deinococcus sp. HSC-46F16]|uniref:DsbA family protein n=1 Tax=Deinococcus sp. HSC-46F16 TaxID=2910968 RepID=UPI00209EBD6D|nr:DsbA family protein [Deinococcus sp. HSC-46F16]MCP2014210.1 putative protein-disulfide isomerase [Deinococcus sp. HSC-46F16]